MITSFLGLDAKPFKVQDDVIITGELKKWHAVTLTFDGPEVSETDEYNPFLNYRLNVTFSHRNSGKKYIIPGYYAADGNAGMTSAKSGNKWRVHFSPDEVGVWDYSVDFKKGKWVAIRSRTERIPSGEYMDGATGTFSIQLTDKTGRDFRAHGRLQYVGERYLRFAETGKIFYKCGTDAPENFLSYYGFDGDFASDGHKDNLVKTWEPHLKDWKEGDPQWSEGRGREIIGALNYLSSKGLNAFSFLTNNIEGDDQNVFPYIDYDTWDRFDCSKLDQWKIVFDHAQKIGLFLHFKTMEYENQGLLDFGGIGGYTKLYYRELIARFGHHLALNWNLTEEFGDWGGFDGVKTMPKYPTEWRALAQYIYDIDPYHHHMVIHNGDDFDPLYGPDFKLTGASLQTTETDFRKVNRLTKQVIDRSTAAGKIWPVACDEPGDPTHALIPDDEDPEHFNARTNGLWGNMLAGGWGTEWYFGYQHPHSDLSCQDYRSRDLFWDMGEICINFFVENDFPVTEMSSHNELISSEEDFCLAKEGDTYIILLKKGGESQLDLKDFDGNYTVKWFDPRKGGAFQDGSIKNIKGSGVKSLGIPPNNPEKDWIVVVQSVEVTLEAVAKADKPRIVLLSDIGGDRDDEQSFTRFMMYADQFDIEGIIATSIRIFLDEKHRPIDGDPQPHYFVKWIKAYAEVRDNLMKHSEGWPEPEKLLTLIRKGVKTGRDPPFNIRTGIAGKGSGHYPLEQLIGKGKDTGASMLIIEVVDRDDPRPVWVPIWGGSVELAQALWRVRNDRSEEEVQKFVAKLRVYAWGHQDATGLWIQENFPDLYYLVSTGGTIYSADPKLHSKEWLDTHVRFNHGPLGALCPIRWGKLGGADSETYLGLIPNGLSDMEHPDWGGWGGRLRKRPGSEKQWIDIKSNVDPDSLGHTISRWASEFQNDYQARMDWCVKEFSEANHPPRPVLNGNKSLKAIKITAKPGQRIELDATGSTDIDNNGLSYEWRFYPEAGTYPKEINIENSYRKTTSFVVPEDASGKTLHVLLVLTDDGAPPLTRYRRLVIHCK